MARPRIVWRTRKDAQYAVTAMKTRLRLTGTAVADALSEALREKPDYKRIVELLSKARAEHIRPFQQETL